MPFVEWNEKFVTGVKECDEQHKKLFNLINELYDAMKEGKGREISDKLLDELINYAKNHFSTEETLMMKYGFPGFDPHKREHEAFKMKVRELLDKKARSELTLSIHLFTFLKEWLFNHIMKTDKEYGPFLLERMKEKLIR